MKTVGELLDTKGHEVLSIGPEATVYDAILTMAHYEIGALLVIDNGGIIGIMSERDYARKIILQNRSSRTTHVAEIMSSNVIMADINDTVTYCMSIMTQKRIRHLPVYNGAIIAGVVSIGDLVKEIISEQQSTIEMLEKYITA